ncbi:Uncharacterised protein [Vibrio cholerae]|nr:Uncharacterised protein [Vibrio cholerae]
MPSSLNASIPNTKESAMIRPPATTTGSMCDTPVIKCLYTPFFSSAFSLVALLAELEKVFACAKALLSSCAVFFNARPVLVL